MSFRKTYSTEKRGGVNLKSSASSITHKSSGIFERFFTRNTPAIPQKTETFFNNNNDNKCLDSDSKLKLLWDLELELIYTNSVLRQRLDHLNRHNLILQLIECARLIEKRLPQCSSFIESLPLESDLILSVRDSLNEVILSNQVFAEWTQSLVGSESVDQNIGHNLFNKLHHAAQNFIEVIKISLGDEGIDKKRRSIDNGLMQTLNMKEDTCYKGRFSEEDREFIEKLKKLDEDIDRPPPKPQLVQVSQKSLDEYLNKIEAIVRAEKESVYEYSEINNGEELIKKNLKVENNCIMTTSTSSQDIPTVDGVALEPQNDVTLTPVVHPRNGLHFFNAPKNVTDSRRSMPERDKNMPLPPVPVTSKVSTKYKNPQIPTSFHSEELHYRKKSLSSVERSKISNSLLNNKSPLRSPSFVSFINQHANRSPMTQSPTKSLINSFGSALKSPTSTSQTPEELSCVALPRHLLIAKQIPNIVSDPNQLLNISDMKDDINIFTRSLENSCDLEKRDSCRRLSNCSVQTTKSLPSTSVEPQGNSSTLTTTNNEDGTIYNSEVKSDTEEYFEYFEIDGKKYRRKMKKRTVIEKIKIQKTVYAPLKPDGSGPDLGKFDEDEQEMLADGIAALKVTEPSDSPERIINPNPPIFRRSTEDRFRVSKSMFLPYKNNIKKLTMSTDGNLSQTPALLTNYMYRFGASEFEEPIIDKRLSTQLIDDVNSSWMKTSEFDLPHEKSKSICYFKNFRQKNEEGNTVHSAYRITASRTVRMKPQYNVTESPIAINPFNNTPIVTVNGEDNFGDDEESEDEIDVEPARNSQFDSFHQSTEDEKEVDSVSSQECTSADQEETLSTTSTMDDSELGDSVVDEPSDILPETRTRSPSPDSCFYSSCHSSYLSETKEQYCFILKENNPTPYLIFDDDAKPGECDIAGGPVDALIVHACDGKEHLLFLGAFLDTYRTFIEPEDLINRLIIRYKFFKSKVLSDVESKLSRIDSGCVENAEDNVRLRNKTDQYEDPEKKCIHILSLLLTIIGKLKKDLTERIHLQIQIFENYLQEINEKAWIEAFKNAIKTQKLSMEKDTEMVQLLCQLSTPLKPQLLVKSPSKENNSPTKGGLGFSSNKGTILDFESRNIAEQMTLLDWSKYRDVELIEVLNLKDIANCKLPGVIEYAKHFQNVRCWTQSILLDPDKKSTSERDRYCWKFLRIMKHLRNLNNFSSLIAILLAIQLLPIKKLFSKRIRTKIMDMDDYMKPTKFVGYKQDLKEATAPCIPFLGLFYQDIVMLNIANPPYLDLDEVTRISRISNWSTNNSQYLSLISEQCGPIINFWRSFKQYIFLKNCNKDQDKIRYSIRPNEKTLQFLNNFQESFDEATIHRFIKHV